MTISISSRIRNAMVGLSITLSLLFTALIFLLVYVIEDRVFANQIKVEQVKYEQSKHADWQPENAKMRLISSAEKLPELLPKALKEAVVKKPGIHEYFDANNALFIAHFVHRENKQSYFLTYDVKELLAVRGSKAELFLLISLLTLLICAASIYLAYRLTKQTLAPVRKLTHELQNSDIDDDAIELANDFSEDEIGVLTHELALALNRVRDSAQREYEFNRGVSHELRTPIQVAQSAAELIELQLSDQSDPLSKPLDRLKRSVSEMNEIVDAFLWLASDRQPSFSDTCSVNTILTLIDHHQAANPKVDWDQKINVSNNFEYALPESVLLVVIRSLLNNAVKHGDRRKILVALSQHTICVENFMDNSNNESSDAMNSENFGLGLNIAQRLCQHFGCELSIEQRKEGSFKARIGL